MGALRALGPRMHMESFQRRDAVEPRGIHSLSARRRESWEPQNGPPAFLQPSHGHRGPSLQDVAAHQELSAHAAGSEQHTEPPAERTPGEGNGEKGGLWAGGLLG